MQIEMKGIDKSFGTNQVLKDATPLWERTEPENLP